jgi:hypothetical protein
LFKLALNNMAIGGITMQMELKLRKYQNTNTQKQTFDG